jgi:anti-sigma regulatory factor (Ser/Thr protein kinase)
MTLIILTIKTEMIDKKTKKPRAIRGQREMVRAFIIREVPAHPADIARLVSEKFDISRQAANVHLSHLVAEGALVSAGNTRKREYSLRQTDIWRRKYSLDGTAAEDVIWREDIGPALGPPPKNVLGIWQHGFTEMFNNAIDHSEGTSVIVALTRSAADTEMVIADDGVGIFRKIQRNLNLLDERHALLELSKGKLTTDPTRHSGEGIFFTSRMFDEFRILSGGVCFSHRIDSDDDWLLENEKFQTGTAVFMRLNSHTTRTTRKIFDKFAIGDDLSFSKTIVPVRLARYGDENLVSRSQARRVLARVDRFRIVILDFHDVADIGQAFADEMFRVFPSEHQTIEIFPMNASLAVRKMIGRVAPKMPRDTKTAD